MSTREDAGPIVEPSGWMRARMAQRRRYVEALGFEPDTAESLIVAPLGRAVRLGTREDRTCDRCRTYVPLTSAEFHTVRMPAARGLLLVGGLCSSCAALEVSP